MITQAEREAIEAGVFLAVDIARRTFQDPTLVQRNVYYRNHVHMVKIQDVVRIHESALYGPVVSQVDPRDRDEVINNIIAKASLPVEWDGYTLWFTIHKKE